MLQFDAVVQFQFGCSVISVSSLIETIRNMGFVKLEIEEACAFSKMDTVL